MTFNFHCKPFKLESNITSGKFYIGGTMPWLDYSDELMKEAMTAYAEWNKPGKVATIVEVPEETFEVVSNSDPDKKYIVTRRSDKSYSCTCSGFGYRRKCSHSEKIKAELEAKK